MAELLSVVDLDAGYASVPVVRGLSLHVDEGEVVALLGPNGAGKTTTLLTISGLLPIIGGQVEFLSQPVRTTRPHQIARRGLAHVPEDRSLFFELTVVENLRLGERATRNGTEYALELFPALASLRNRRAGLLSGGEQQMLALARALASRPRLLVVDEMSLGLAPVIVERLFPVLRAVADSGCAVLLVEQHVAMALECSDRAYVLSHGRVHYEGPSQHLVTHPDLLQRSYLGDDAAEPSTNSSGT